MDVSQLCTTALGATRSGHLLESLNLRLRSLELSAQESGQGVDAATVKMVAAGGLLHEQSSANFLVLGDLDMGVSPDVRKGSEYSLNSIPMH